MFSEGDIVYDFQWGAGLIREIFNGKQRSAGVCNDLLNQTQNE